MQRFALVHWHIQQRLVLARFGCFQGTQQAFKAFLVRIVVFPVGKVADMAGVFDILRPLGVTCQDCVIYANGKQGIEHTLRFFVQCFLDLVGYPIAGYRMFREYQQQFVLLSDGFVNTWSDFIPNFHVFWCKPATHIVTLQIGVQKFGKSFILTGVADKAAIVLNGLAGNIFHVDEKGVRYAGATYKRFGDVTLRQIDGVDAQWRRASMFNGFQPFDKAKVLVSKGCYSYDCLSKVGIFQFGKAEVSTSEISTSEVSTSEVSTSEVGIAEVGIAEVGIAEVGTAEVSKGEGIAEVGIAEIGKIEVSKDEVNIDEVGIVEVGKKEMSKVEIGIAKIGINEVGTLEIGRIELGMIEVSIFEVGTREVGKVEFGKVEVNIFEVRDCYGNVVYSPCIPLWNTVS